MLWDNRKANNDSCRKIFQPNLMEQANHGTLTIIGSITGDRGRKFNYCYGAAKGKVGRFTQSLQHRLMQN